MGAQSAFPRMPRTVARDLFALLQREFPDAAVGFCFDGSRVWVEQLGERVEWTQTSAGGWTRAGGTSFAQDLVVFATRRTLDEAAARRARTLDTTAAMQAATQAEHIDTLNEDPAAAAAAKKRAPTNTITVNVRVLDIDALTQAIEEQAKREKAHAAKGPTMTTQTKTQALTQTIKLDASEAAWRTAGSQFVKLAREPLVGLLTRHLAPNDDAFRARLAAFLETELGSALLASMLSATLSALPQTTGEVPQKLARELRVKAMADAGDVMADVLMGPLREVMRLYLQDPQGAPAAAHALDAPQQTGVEFAATTQREGVR